MEEFKKYKYAIEACQNFIQFEENQDKTIAVWKKLSVLHAKDNNYLGEIHSLIEMSEICTTSIASISANVNRLNLLLSEGKLNSNKEERDAIVFRMIKIISNRMEFDIENFDEYTKIAWLYVHIGKIKEARKTIANILKIDPNHRYALKLSKTIKL
ncbi:MAG: hypothetical protein K8R31_05720 [Bacteroidales bacterium]|nr:hypothetical protein [Bacteroidales bacterium]